MLVRPTWTATRVRNLPRSSPSLQINNEPYSTADSANCCSGSHKTPQTCPPSGVQFYSYFSASISQQFSLIHVLNGGSPPYREQLPQLLRLRLRRKQQNCFVDLWTGEQQRLYHHFLPVVRSHQVFTYQIFTYPMVPSECGK